MRHLDFIIDPRAPILHELGKDALDHPPARQHHKGALRGWTEHRGQHDATVPHDPRNYARFVAAIHLHAAHFVRAAMSAVQELLGLGALQHGRWRPQHGLHQTQHVDQQMAFVPGDVLVIVVASCARDVNRFHTLMVSAPCGRVLVASRAAATLAQGVVDPLLGAIVRPVLEIVVTLFQFGFSRGSIRHAIPPTATYQIASRTCRMSNDCG